MEGGYGDEATDQDPEGRSAHPAGTDPDRPRRTWSRDRAREGAALRGALTPRRL